MKKFFTLVAGLLLVCGAANAQKEWTSVIVNGNMEGEADPMWSSFWCHDWREGVEFDPASGQQYDPSNVTETSPGQFQGFAEIVEDPANPANHVARVIIRSKAEADEAGNPTTDTANNKPDWAEWDSQFFIYATDPIPEGKEIRMTLKVKGEKAGTFQTQAHYTPGDYNFYQLFGDCSYGTEWSTIQVEATVDGNHTQEANGKFFQSVAFNLSTMQDGNVIYFDDVRLEIRDPEGASEFTGWFNMLRHGTESKDRLAGTNFTTFTGRDGIDNIDEPCPVVADPLDGKPALTVGAVGYNGYKRTAMKDEDGNYIIGDDGQVQYEVSENMDVYITQQGDTLGSLDDWRTQFFVTSNHKFVQGETLKVRFSARADKPQSVETQVHRNPGDYVHYVGIGTFNLTEEWQQFETETTFDGSQKGGWTIAFNCNRLKTEDSNLYFRFDEFSFNAPQVKEDERVLDSEEIILPVPEPDGDDAHGVVDFTNCIAVLECTDYQNLMNDDHMKLPVNDNGDLSTTQQAFTGVFMDENGYLVDDSKLLFAVEEGSTVDATDFVVSNFGDSFEGKSINTKLYFTYNGWNYLFNTKFVPASEYSGVTTVEQTKHDDGAVYDLQGRRVQQVAKGLYIMNGKKYIVK